MLRLLGVLVGASLAVLVYLVAPSGAGGGGAARAEERARRPAAGPSAPRLISPRPVPRLPEVEEVAPVEEEPAIAEEPAAEEAPEPPAQPEGAGEVQAASAAEEYAPTAADERLLARVLEILDDFAGAIEGNAGQCGRMAEAIREVVEGARDLKEQVDELNRDLARSRWLQRQLEGKATALMTRMVPLQACMNDKRMLEVMQEMQDL